MTSPMIPVSWGELLDKVTILEIKVYRLHQPHARANAAAELAVLRQSLPVAQGTAELLAALRSVNARLWRIEELIREKEAAADFGAGFISLARAVYHENDERGRIKQALNRQLNSTLCEEKQYPDYQKAVGA